MIRQPWMLILVVGVLIGVALAIIVPFLPPWMILPPPKPPPPPGPPGHPRVQGPDAVVPLLRAMAATRLGVPYRWTTDDDGEPAVVSLAGAATGATKAEEFIWKRLHGVRVPQGYLNLIAGSADVLITTRPPNSKEREMAAAAGVVLRPEPVALDAFVFIVHADNPVADLRLDQVRAIYAGQLTDWSAVGGRPGRIVAHQRRPDATGRILMDELVMGGLPTPPATRPYLLGEEALLDAVAGDPDAIVYCPRHRPAMVAAAGRLKILRLNGFAPTPADLAAGRYPLPVELLLVTRADLPESQPVAELRSWLFSPAGQRLIREAGYTPVEERVTADN